MSEKLEGVSGYKIAGLTVDALQKLRDGIITVEEFEKFLQLPAEERQRLFGTVVANKILKLISGGEKIIIGACDGTETIAKAGDVYKSYLDSDFKKWGTDKPGQATKETAVEVREMDKKDATFTQMFGSLGTDLDKLCLTQHQIKSFCKNHTQWLRGEGYATFFLFKVDDQFFVARVDVRSDGLRVFVRRLGYDYVWDARYHHRVVTPQL